MTNYFPEHEQACTHCGEINLADGFLDALNELREAVDHPMVVNSMCRCEERNNAVGGVAGSYHLTNNNWGCCAADISTKGWSGAKRREFALAAMQRDFSFHYDKSAQFIHIDLRGEYTNNKPVLY